MLITQGKVSGFSKLPWAQIELASDSRLEEVVLHLVRWIRKRPEAFRLLFPVQSRDLGGIELFYPYLLIQCKDLRILREIRVMGVQGVTMQSESEPLTVDAEYAEALIVESERIASGWSSGVKRGDFVRVLLGKRRMLAGDVVAVKNGIADVRISLTVRDLRLRIPARALLRLEVAKKERRYYGR